MLEEEPMLEMLSGVAAPALSATAGAAAKGTENHTGMRLLEK